MQQKIINFGPIPQGSSRKRQPARHAKPKRKRADAVNLVLFLPLAIFFMECVIRFGLYGSVCNVYTILFSLSTGLLLVLLCTAFSQKANHVITLVVLSTLSVLYGFHFGYDRFFGSVFTWSIVENNAGNFTEFYREILTTIAENLGGILLMFVPLVLYAVLGNRLAPAYRSNARARIVYVVLMVALHLGAVALIGCDKSAYGDHFYYHTTINTNETMARFGLMTTTRIDLTQLIFGTPTETVEKPAGDVSDLVDEQPGMSQDDVDESPVTYVDQVMDIDFDTLIAGETNDVVRNLHEYFADVKPTQTNAYTGMFEGKNLIFLTLEGFCDQVIDPELTPTLYRMATEGFVFENFYTSMWGGSTATGEYAAMTGNFYYGPHCSDCLKISGSKSMPFTLGTQLRDEGYLTLAYHNHTAHYYGRDKSHPNFGYSYKAIEQGLEMTDLWPRSDLEMAQITVEDYIDSEQPFHVYYMTVSGHANYSFVGNNMSKKHRDQVDHLPYTENVKAYIACQLEVEEMLTELVERLDAAGKLEDTVFAMSADHYPYALSDAELAELYDLPVENIQDNFDLYRNGFILWSASMEEPVRVTKPASSIDILPTLSNLFGLEYDSRLLMGTDILSSADPVVILNCNGDGGWWHWITPYGRYNTQTKTFAMADGLTWDETKQANYVQAINQIVSAKRTAAKNMLDNDYYRYVFG